MTSLVAKHWLLEILKTYKEMPYLWDRRHPDYKDRAISNKSYEYLLQFYKKVDENATKESLRKKLQNLKTGYFKELRKVNMSKQTATRPEDIYMPTLWYYRALSFLTTESEHAPGSDTIYEIEDSDLSSDHEGDTQEAEIHPPPPKKIKEEKIEKNKSKEEIMPFEENLTVQIKEEEWDILAKSLAIQLRDINKKQFIITQKLISDTIYYAKMGLLTESSHISLEAMHPKTPQHEMPSTSSHR